jgi:hypothetical protein
MRSVCHCRAGGLVTFLKPGSKKANEPESGVNAVMALTRGCLGACRFSEGRDPFASDSSRP